MVRILNYLSIVCIVCTLIPFFPTDYWMVRVFDYPHAQLTVLTLVAIIGHFIFYKKNARRKLLLVLALCICIVYQSSIIFPYTPLSSYEVETSISMDMDQSISLLSANVLMKNRNAGPIIQEINSSEPDIVILLETDIWWMKKMDVLNQKYSYSKHCPLGNTYGMLVFSKLEFIDPEYKFIIEDSIPSFHSKVMLRSGQEVQLYVVHPTPPAPKENTKSTERDGELLMVGKMAKDSPLPVIVIGDLNDVAWSFSTCLFQEVSGLLDPRKGRGLFNTFHAKIPILRWPLDHVFHSNDFRLKSIQRLPDVKSDHFPVFVELSHEPEAKKEQKEPHASSREEQKANEKIGKAKEQSN